MNPVLASRDGEWYLAAFAPHIEGCNLSTVVEPRSQSDKFHRWRDKIYVQRHAPLDGVTFYPELYWQEYRVQPLSWNTEMSEPALVCQLDLAQLAGEGEHAVSALVDELLAAGWTRPDRSLMQSPIKLADLQMIEGPTPV